MSTTPSYEPPTLSSPEIITLGSGSPHSTMSPEIQVVQRLIVPPAANARIASQPSVDTTTVKSKGEEGMTLGTRYSSDKSEQRVKAEKEAKDGGSSSERTSAVAVEKVHPFFDDPTADLTLVSKAGELFMYHCHQLTRKSYVYKLFAAMIGTGATTLGTEHHRASRRIDLSRFSSASIEKYLYYLSSNSRLSIPSRGTHDALVETYELACFLNDDDFRTSVLCALRRSRELSPFHMLEMASQHNDDMDLIDAAFCKLRRQHEGAGVGQDDALLNRIRESVYRLPHSYIAELAIRSFALPMQFTSSCSGGLSWVTEHDSDKTFASAIRNSRGSPDGNDAMGRQGEGELLTCDLQDGGGVGTS